MKPEDTPEDKDERTIEDMLVDKALLFRVFLLSAMKLQMTDEDIVRVTEATVTSVKRRKNEHTRNHATKYDDNCIFCVDTVSQSNPK